MPRVVRGASAAPGWVQGALLHCRRRCDPHPHLCISLSAAPP